MKNQHILQEAQSIQLNNWDKLAHYRLPLALFTVPIIITILDIIGIINFEVHFLSFTFYLFLFLISIGFLMYLFQKKRLKFKEATTHLNKVELIQTIEDIGKKLEWQFTKKEEGFIEAITRPGLLSGSWGERITIKYKGNQVFVNSICDPDKRASLSASGRNKKNEQTLLQSVKKNDGMNSFIEKA